MVIFMVEVLASSLLEAKITQGELTGHTAGGAGSALCSWAVREDWAFWEGVDYIRAFQSEGEYSAASVDSMRKTKHVNIF